MDWLHKTRHKDEDNSNSPEKKIERSDNLQNKINAQQEHLDSISKKLEVVKGEYGEVISSLMSAKKELAEKRKEISLLKLPSQDGQKKSRKGDSLEFKKQLEMEHVLNDFMIKKEEVEEQLQKTNSKLKDARSELENIEGKKHKIFEELIKKDNEKVPTTEKLSKQKNDSKRVVQAASSVIATMHTKLTKAEKELEEMVKLLEEEREEHQKTKRELGSLKSKD